VDENKSHHRVDLAKDLIRSKELDAAEQEGKAALSLNPKNDEAYYILGLIDFLRGVNSFLLLEQQDCLSGVDAEVLREEMEARFTAADQSLAKAVEMAPGYGDAWAARGLIQIQLENFELALQYFEKAFEGKARLDNIGLTRAHVGWARFMLGETAKAAKELRQALQFQPNMCVARFRLGRVYFARHEWDKALTEFAAVADDKTCGLQEAHLYRLKSLVALGQTDGVDQVRQSCVAIAPKSCMARECAMVKNGSRVANGRTNVKN
jgi:tetratricopeptide (TPR) repeat protein